jgi:hypothetical protein
MTESTDGPTTWEEIGLATEDFARRVARDAGRLAQRVREHAGEFAREVRRDQRRARRRVRANGCRPRTASGAPEVRRVFEDIRSLLTGVLDGIDQLAGHALPATETTADEAWLRIVMNRAATCSACGKAIGIGEESDVQRLPEGTAFRCRACGPQAAEPPAADPESVPN